MSCHEVRAGQRWDWGNLWKRWQLCWYFQGENKWYKSYFKQSCLGLGSFWMSMELCAEIRVVFCLHWMMVETSIHTGYRKIEKNFCAFSCLLWPTAGWTARTVSFCASEKSNIHPLGVSLGSTTGMVNHNELPATESSWSRTWRTKAQLCATACLYIFALSWNKVSLIASNVEIVVELGQVCRLCSHFPALWIFSFNSAEDRCHKQLFHVGWFSFSLTHTCLLKPKPIFSLTIALDVVIPNHLWLSSAEIIMHSVGIIRWLNHALCCCLWAD